MRVQDKEVYRVGKKKKKDGVKGGIKLIIRQLEDHLSLLSHVELSS